MPLPGDRSRLSPLTFVVGTGRSGSTALSQILNRHPQILSINELLTSVGDRAFPAGILTGDQFWDVLSTPNPLLDALVRGGAHMPELIYPTERGRYSSRTTGVPAICLTVLPHLTAEPDAAFDELGADIRKWPARTAPDHYRELFSNLRSRFGGQVTVERSGHSLEWIPRLRENFPEARFIHMHRDGADVALSMSRHAGFRLVYSLREVLRRTGAVSLAQVTPTQFASLPPELSGLFSRRLDHSTLMGRDIPVARFGEMWSELIREGSAELAMLPPGAWTTLRYEDLLRRPHRELSRIAAFLSVSAPSDWLDWAGASLHRDRQGRARQLARAELAALEAACRPGKERLDGAA